MNLEAPRRAMNLRNLMPMLKGKAQPEGVTPEVAERPQKINSKAIEKATKILKDYKEGKKSLEARIVEEEQWWKVQHWNIIGKDDKNKNRPQPASAWLFNSIANKHADMMDNYPEPNVLPREKGDEQSAKVLSSILPVIYERNNYEETYSDAAWYKLKHGVVAKGVFWNTELEDGLGDIDTQFIDMLNIFWQPGITNLQSSRNLFIVSLKDNDLLEMEYPQLKGKIGGKVIDVKEYVYDDAVDVSDKSVVVDWYYKKRNTAGKTVLHFCKYVGSEILFASENEPEYAENGFYNHGQYPVEFDVLFPEEGTPTGFGYISIMKSPQMYIDKLKQVVLENAVKATKTRFFAKKNVGINIDEFRDDTNDIVFVEGDIDEERLRQIDVQQVGGAAQNILQMTIDELKETSGNRDFSQGSTASGVTSGAAISALQEAGNKLSRDLISASYRSYKRECYLAIELMRQFYDETRSFRIIGETGKYEFVDFSNKMMQGEPIPPAYEGQEDEEGYVELFRKPVYDVVVKPQKRSPYSKLAQNELAKELYQLGVFNPQLADQAMTLLEMMDFDGIEKVKEKVQKGQTLMNIVNQLTQKIAMLESLMGVGTAQPQQPLPSEATQSHSGSGMGQAQKQAQTANMTSYGERLAKRANPDMNNG